MISVKEIVTEYLVANGYDGLCADECGCTVRDGLIPCDGPCDECVAGHIVPCTCGEGCDYDVEPGPRPPAATVKCRECGTTGIAADTACPVCDAPPQRPFDPATCQLTDKCPGNPLCAYGCDHYRTCYPQAIVAGDGEDGR